MEPGLLAVSKPDRSSPLFFYGVGRFLQRLVHIVIVGCTIYVFITCQVISQCSPTGFHVNLEHEQEQKYKSDDGHKRGYP